MGSGENNPGPNWANQIITIINRVGFAVAVAGYYLYKDWYFTKDLLETQTKMLLSQQQIADALQRIASLITH